MCTKTPKAPAETPPIYLTNPLLSGLRIGAGTGRNSLRTDLPSAPRMTDVTGPLRPNPMAEVDNAQRIQDQIDALGPRPSRALVHVGARKEYDRKVATIRSRG